MIMEQGMTDKETAEHLRQWVIGSHSHWAWPTDACGYDQHIKFVKHRNANWDGRTPAEFNQFILDYAESLAPSEETLIVR